MLHLVQLLWKVSVVLMYNLSMLGVFTVIWVSFDYHAYDACDTESDCFISYIDDRVNRMIDASITSM